MGAVLALLRPRERFSGYERMLEKVDKELQQAQMHIAVLERRKKLIGNISYVMFIVSFLSFGFYVAKLKLTDNRLSHLEHFMRVARASLVPLSVEAVCFATSSIMKFLGNRMRRHVDRLQKQKKNVLTDIKKATCYDQVYGLLMKHDPSLQTAPVPRAGPLTPVPPRQPLLVGSPVLRQSGQAALHLLQSTGQALSPMLESLTGWVEDDPSLSALLRHTLQERDALRREVEYLRSQLIAAGVDVQDPARSDVEGAQASGLSMAVVEHNLGQSTLPPVHASEDQETMQGPGEVSHAGDDASGIEGQWHLTPTR